MKSLGNFINKKKHLLFLDLEGTQFSHEMIAFGAIKVELDNKLEIKKINKGIKYYVKSIGPIGGFVQELTGITPETLSTKGITYSEALKHIKKYCGRSFKNMGFVTFGNHDLRIIAKSLEVSQDADKDIAYTIIHNHIDLAAILSQYVKDEHGNPYSLVNYLNIFGLKPTGVSHDPLNDANDLLLLYRVILKSDDIIYQEYLKVLKNMKHFPDPVHQIIVKLVNGEDVTSKEFKEKVRNYIS